MRIRSFGSAQVLAKIRSGMKAERVSQVIKGAASAAGAKLLLSGVSLFTLPLAVRYLGAERYGIWVTVSTITSWIALLDLGISNTLTNSISTAFANDDNSMAAHHTSNALMITLSIAGLLGLISAVVWANTDWMHLFNVSTRVQAGEVRQTVAIAFALVLLSPTCALGGKVLSGYQETHTYNFISAAGAVGSLIGLAIGVMLHFNMPMLFLCTSGTVTACGLGTLGWIVFFHKPWLRPRLAYIQLPVIRELTGSGASLFIIQIASIVVFSTDNLIVGHYLGASEVTPYSVTMRLVAYAQLLPTFLFPSLWPAYAEANARRDFRWIRRAFSFTMMGSLLTMALSLTVFVIFGRVFIRWWAGTAAVPTQLLIVAMAVWTLISALTGVQSCLLSAVGRTRVQATLSIIAAGVNVALSIYLVQIIGSLGAVLGTIISYLTIVVLPLTWEVKRYFRQTGSLSETLPA